MVRGAIKLKIKNKSYLIILSSKKIKKKKKNLKETKYFGNL